MDDSVIGVVLLVLLLGLLGYLGSARLVWFMRVLLGRAGGWPRILTNALLVRELFLALLFMFTLVNVIDRIVDIVSDEFQASLRIFVTIGFLAIPWWLIYLLSRWIGDAVNEGRMEPPPFLPRGFHRWAARRRKGRADG